jgi:hypothetical protein
MKKILLYSVVSLSLAACVSVPEQAVVSQELVLKGLESAQKNQVTLINAYADDQIANTKKVMSGIVIDKVLKKQLNGRTSLPEEEVKQLMLEYAQDLTEQIAKIETQRRDLLKVASENYGELISLTQSNLNLTRSLVKSSDQQNQLLENYQQKLKDVEGALKLYLQSEGK